MNKNVKSIVVLTIICIVVAGLLSVTNGFTAPIIEEHKQAAATASLTQVMPDGKGFEEMEIPSDAASTVQQIYKETSGQGYVVLLATRSQYSSDDMGITVGIGNDGIIKGVAITSYYETKNFGDYPQTYVGADSALNGIDVFAGATYSSTAFKNAITDAFNVLISGGFISEGEKSEETLIAELMPTVLPGCANSLGAAQVTETDAKGFAAAYAANNDCGYIVVAETANGKVVCGVNAFGDVNCVDLEGNASEGPVDDIKAAFAAKATELADSNFKVAAKVAGDGAELTAISDIDVFNCITGAYTAVKDGETYYIFNTKTFGYSNEVMEMAVALDKDGKVVNYRSVTDLILHEEYYTSHSLTDKSAYRQGLVGLDASSDIDSKTTVAGATFTAYAVKTTLQSAFEAFKALNK